MAKLMATNSFLRDPDQIKFWIETYFKVHGPLEITEEGIVNVRGSINANESSGNRLKRFAVEFGTVDGYFDISLCKHLVSLDGAPKIVMGSYSCVGCSLLTSLQGAALYVGNKFSCRDCTLLTDLVGAPEQVGGTFNAQHCRQLRSLTGLPKLIGKDLNLENNSELTTFDAADSEILGSVICYGLPKLNTLETLPGKIGGMLDLHDCPSLNSIRSCTSQIAGKIKWPDLDELFCSVPFTELVLSANNILRDQIPSYAAIATLLDHRINLSACLFTDEFLQTEKQPAWYTLVRNYHQTGDILTAIDEFSQVYGAMYIPKMTVAQEPAEITIDLLR